MELIEILTTLVFSVLAMLLTATAICIDRRQLSKTVRELRERARIALPFLAFLGIVLLFNAQHRWTVNEISHVIGFRITSHIFRFEGTTILWIQSLFGERFEVFFQFMYIYGYVFLLVFPFLAYFVLDKMDMFKSLSLAYSANYAIGVVFYMLFIVYGPRNMLVNEPILETYPFHLQMLMTEFNESTNVFPSLHTSLSATVMLFAWRTREVYPKWMYIAMFFGTSVIIATMYLAIHWVVDVLAGLVLAVFSYWLGVKIIEEGWLGRIDWRGRLTRLRTVFRQP